MDVLAKMFEEKNGCFLTVEDVNNLVHQQTSLSRRDVGHAIKMLFPGVERSRKTFDGKKAYVYMGLSHKDLSHGEEANNAHVS